jgi:hypothetical protein
VLVTDPYPYLDHLLGSYFHQDALDDGETAEQIIEQFKATSHAYEVLGTRADIARFLALHEKEVRFREVFERTFRPDVIIGRTDDEARAWLQTALDLLNR